MENEFQPYQLTAPRSLSLKGLRTNSRSKMLVDSRYKRESQDNSLRCIYDLHAMEVQLSRILQHNSGISLDKRTTSVENYEKGLKQKKIDLKKFELRRKIATPSKSRIELKPLILTKCRSPVQGSYSNISTQRELLSDSERNIDLSQAKLNSYRSVPHSISSSRISSPKDEPALVNKLVEQEQERKQTQNLVLPRISKEFSPQDLVFAPHVKPTILKQHAFRVVQGIFYATQRVKPLPISHLYSKQIELPPASDPLKKTLVLDLDETLIYATKRDTSEEKQTINNEAESSPMRVKIRPYAIDFLKEMSKTFEIVIFTAAEKNYAETMIKLLDPDRKYIMHILHREHCLKTLKGLFLKDLRIIKNRDLKNTIIVDNFTPSFSFQIDNGVPIITWQGDSHDKELKYLMNYLLEANQFDDVREYNREKLNLRELAELSSEKIDELQN